MGVESRHADGDAGPGSGSAGFVGRARELVAITGALAAGPGLVLVEGEAGVGKTSLVRECLRHRALSGLRVLQACCPPLVDPFPLGAMVDALRGLRIGELALSPLAGALRPLFPEFSAELPPALESLEDPSATRHRLFRAVAELVEAAGVDVLVLEDAHWADVATLDFLLTLCATSGRSISLVVTYRGTDLAAGSRLLRLTSRLPARMTQVKVALAPLDIDESAALLASILGAGDVPADFVSFLHQRTEGVPLALVESVTLLRERGDLVLRGGRWSWQLLDEPQVPPTVRDSVLERVQRLDPVAQRVLRAAAVLTEPADEPTLGRVTGLNPALTRAGLAAALRSGLLREAEPGRFTCRHVLASQAIEAAVPISERRRLHAQVARALQRLDPPPVARMGRHFREAGDVSAWARCAEAAAAEALTQGEDRVAVALLHELLSQAEHPPVRHARLARNLGEAAVWGVAALGDLADAVTGTLSAALRGADLPRGDRGEIRLLLGRLLLQLGEFDEATEQIEVAVGELTQRRMLAARAMISLAFPRGQDWPASKHLEWLRRATKLFGQVSSEGERAWLAVERASALLMLGEAEGWAAADQLDVAAATLPERRQVARGLMNVGHLAIAWGRDDEARGRLDAAVELMAATGYQRLLNSAKLTKANLDWQAGNWDGLAEQVTRLVDAEDTLPEATLEGRLILALCELGAGRRAAAEQLLRTMLLEVDRRGLADVRASPAALLGRLRLSDDDHQGAIDVTRPSLEMIAKKGMWLWATELAPVQVEALVLAERIDAAEELVARFTEGIGDLDAPAPLAALRVCAGIVAAGRGDHENAAALFDRAAGAFSELPRPYHELLTAERQGRSLLLTADGGDTGLTVLTSVQRRLRALGARWDADRVARLLREHGVDVALTWRGGRRGYGERLSPRELEVACLVAEGMTNRQAAEALFLSPRTVDRHMSAAMRKLGVTSRTALAVAVADAGLLPGRPGAGGSRPDWLAEQTDGTR